MVAARSPNNLPNKWVNKPIDHRYNEWCLGSVDCVGVEKEATSPWTKQTLNAEQRFDTGIVEARHVRRTIPVISHALAPSGDLSVESIFSLAAYNIPLKEKNHQKWLLMKILLPSHELSKKTR